MFYIVLKGCFQTMKKTKQRYTTKDYISPR